MGFPASELGGGEELVEVRIRASQTQMDLERVGASEETTWPRTNLSLLSLGDPNLRSHWPASTHKEPKKMVQVWVPDLKIKPRAIH